MVFSYILALCRSSSSKNLKKWQIIWTWATISFKIFWDFLMFYQIFLSPQVKRWAIITYKHGIYELPHELPNDVRLGTWGNKEISGKCQRIMDDSLVPSPSAKMKVLLILAKNSRKAEIKFSPLCAISHGN